MERTNSVNQPKRDTRTVEDLHLDRVVASQPEVGPTPPDGGYGWVIVFSAVIYHITVPSLLVLYGFIILKAIRDEDREEGERMKIWDVNLAIVPMILVVMKLLLDSWCRAIVKIFNMPRFTALSGLCMTVAGVLLSSYSTSMYNNDHIINIFAGILAGAGCALTGQQTDLIISHYFRDKLVIAQRLVRISPTVGNVLIPLLVGYLCTIYTGDTVVMIYGAILMQNCLFLATFTRPIYIEKVIRTTYNMIKAVEDEDEVIFSNQNIQADTSEQNTRTTTVAAVNIISNEDTTDLVLSNPQKVVKDNDDPEILRRDKSQSRFSTDFSTMEQPNRFSSDFSTMFYESGSNRFSSDFGSFEIGNRISGYQELESIDRNNQNVLPLYRETTVNSPTSLVFPSEVTPGTARRTASLKKNFITVTSMLMDINFYLYTLLHLCTTFSILILGVIFPPMMWELNPSMNIWSVATMTSIAHTGALCFVLLCLILPNNINETSRLYAVFCTCGALGYYGLSLSTNKSFLVLWCMITSLSTAASGMLQQPLYNALNDFDTTATMTTANTIVATVLMVWSISSSYEYRTYFFMSSLLHTGAACVFFISSFRRRR